MIEQEVKITKTRGNVHRWASSSTTQFCYFITLSLLCPQVMDMCFDRMMMAVVAKLVGANDVVF